MRMRLKIGVVGIVALAAVPGWGQMHRVTAPPQQVVRAVGVYEWTGDMEKPKASRLIAVSLFINGQFQDAGEYLARPVPFALDTGNVYVLSSAGIGRGTLDLESARHVQDANNDFEDSWYGYGSYHGPVVERPKVAKKLTPARTSGIVSSVADSDRPTLVRRQGAESTSGNGSGKASTQDTTGGAASSGSAPADDPDRPTLQRPASESGADGSTTSQSGTASAGTTSASAASAGTTASAGGGSAPGDDPDRPTLKRRTPAQAKQAQEEAAVSGTGVDLALNDDPNRPKLHFGKPSGGDADQPSRLVGAPSDLHQMVAVSDAVDRDPHNFARDWTDAAERAAILEKMQALARTQLASYEVSHVAASATAAKKKTVAGRPQRKASAAPAPAPVALMDEVLKGYTLSYGGDATYVYMAHTGGTGSALRDVTVVAQTDEMGELRPVIESVTDAAHLDRTAQMKFVDVVDADASNRASLLFELKAQSSRQFALYRVLAGQSQQIFVSGSTE